MQQGSPEWLEWRRAGIGASEMAAVLGESPYQTPFQLWKSKLDSGAEAPEGTGDSALMARGHQFESMVRASYELQTGLEFTTPCFEHPQLPFLRASLDGWNAERRAGLEIKYVGKDKIVLPIPRHHYIQVQHQMLVTATESWTYIRTTDGVSFFPETIAADLALQRTILYKGTNFWLDVLTRTQPPYTDADWVPVEDPMLESFLQVWYTAPKGARKDEARAQVLAHCKGRRRTLCSGVKISTNPPRLTLLKEAA